MKNKLLLKDFFKEPEKYTVDPVIVWYFGETEKGIIRHMKNIRNEDFVSCLSLTTSSVTE